MKDQSKNFFAGKNIKKNQTNSGYNFHSEKNNPSKKENNFLINSPKSKRSNYLNELDKKKSNFLSSKRRNLTNKSKKDVSYNSQNNPQEHHVKKNFDDWIWGKHSVFETLVSDRAINRIWCTSEIFSSEKFYILLKDLKSKGVLVEEVSWNRLSQLTCGASHQGIALQLASSKTISLE